MNTTLREIVSKWNGGFYRGSQRKLAKALGFNEATVSNWFKGRGSPGEQARVKMAVILGIKKDAVDSFFPRMESAEDLYSGFKKRGLIVVEKTTGETRSVLQVEIPNDLVEKFMDVCKEERRDSNGQMEIILEQWFAQREKPKTQKVYGPGEYPPVGEETGDTIIWPTTRPVSKVHPPTRPIKSPSPRTHGDH